MKKEIEVWVYTNNLGNSIQNLESEKSWINVFSPENKCIDRSQMSRARLVIEIPERKIELTESEFDEAIYDSCHSGVHDGKSWRQMMDSLKQKLFKGDA